MTYVVFKEILKRISDFRSDDSFPIKNESWVLTSPKVLYYKMKLLTWTIQKKVVQDHKSQKKVKKVQISNFKKFIQFIFQNEALDLNYSMLLVLRPFKVIWVQKSGKIDKKGQISIFIKRPYGDFVQGLITSPPV